MCSYNEGLFDVGGFRRARNKEAKTRALNLHPLVCLVHVTDKPVGCNDQYQVFADDVNSAL